MNDQSNNGFVVTFNNLKDAFATFLECQRENPDMVYMISEDSIHLDEESEFVGKESDVLFSVLSGITNCCFLPESAEELFPGNGKPQLMMKLEFCDVYNNGDMERLQKIQSLPVYKKFTHLKIDSDYHPFRHWLCVDCGEDVEAMAEICQSLIADVYSTSLTQAWDFMVLESEKKKDVQKKNKKKVSKSLVVTKIQ
jgi:hypothetical protein